MVIGRPVYVPCEHGAKMRNDKLIQMKHAAVMHG